VVANHDANLEREADVMGARALRKLWKTPATAKEVMAPQGFSEGRSAEIVVFQSFPNHRRLSIRINRLA
jgi:hypothetical protein